jgi:23S rRNA pseudouridine1911/1915/1917 synthase
MIQSFVVETDSGSVRADRWISGKLDGSSRSTIKKAFEQGLVAVNGKVVYRSIKVYPGDKVEFEMPEEKPHDLTPVDIALKVLFEDEHILVIDKPAGLVVHPGAGTDEPTLVHALLHHCDGKLSTLGGMERQGIVHRLDRGTSGLLVIAKTNEAHEVLVHDFSNRTIKKEYLALVAGVPDRLSGTIHKPIGRNPAHRHKMAVREEGKPSHTDWEFLGESKGPVSLLLCRIHTGRTHQIRVHLADMGFPILGDEVYGYRVNRVDLEETPARTMLHAYRLSLKHPISGEAISFCAKPPEDFQAIFPEWEERIKVAERQ